MSKGGKVGVEANVDIILRDGDGNILEEIHVSNLVVDTGFDAVIRLILGDVESDPNTMFRSIAIGTGTTAPQPEDTELETEFDRRIADSPATFPSQGVTVVQKTFDGFPPGPSTEITEAGLLNNGDVLLCRVTFSPITIVFGSNVEFIWTLTFT